MTSGVGMGLAKVTVSTPTRRVDVALPEDVPVAELLPYLLRHAGEDTADSGERHGGWSVRRPTGELLDTRQTLAAQQVLDGEMLHLVPGETAWPELEYDDVVEAIASGSRRYGRSWDRAATRRCGLLVCCALLLLGTLMTLAFRPPWLVPGLILLATALVLLGAGVVIARAYPDARAGAVFGGCGLVYSFLGGYLLAGPGYTGIAGFGAPQLLLGSTTLLLSAVVGYVGIGAVTRVFTAAIAVGLFGVLAATVASGLSPDATGAVVITVAICLLPSYPLLAARLGRLPFPELPQRPSELLEDTPSPRPPAVFAAAARSDEILTGLLLGASIVAAGGSLALLAHGGTARLLLLGAAAVALLLRSRLFAIPRQRLPLLSAGILIGAVLTAALVGTSGSNAVRAWYLLAVCVLAALCAFAGMVYSKKNPSPHLGRFADVFDVVAILALLPFTGYITGFFTYVQELMASIG